MATETDAPTTRGVDAYVLLTGPVGGAVAAVVTGLVIQFGFDPAIISEGIAGGVGRSGLAAGWAVFLAVGAAAGLAYVGVARIGRLGASAALPGPGASLGFAYGLVLWAVAVVLVPVWVGGGVGDVGDYAVTARGVLSFALLGTLVGLVYGVSPYTD